MKMYQSAAATAAQYLEEMDCGECKSEMDTNRNVPERNGEWRKILTQSLCSFNAKDAERKQHIERHKAQKLQYGKKELVRRRKGDAGKAYLGSVQLLRWRRTCGKEEKGGKKQKGRLAFKAPYTDNCPHLQVHRGACYSTSMYSTAVAR